MVKLKTELTHRFNRPITVDSKFYLVDEYGFIEVEDIETAELIVEKENGFEFADGTKYEKKIDANKKTIEKDKVIIPSVVDNDQDDKKTNENTLTDLSKFTKKQLEELLIETGIEKKLWQGKNKTDLIAIIKDKVK